jgi:hypothetical protein
VYRKYRKPSINLAGPKNREASSRLTTTWTSYILISFWYTYLKLY